MDVERSILSYSLVPRYLVKCDCAKTDSDYVSVLILSRQTGIGKSKKIREGGKYQRKKRLLHLESKSRAS